MKIAKKRIPVYIVILSQVEDSKVYTSHKQFHAVVKVFPNKPYYIHRK